MVLARLFDLKAVSLQRTGRLGTYAVSLGQEAVSVGIASAMRQEDVLLPSYRDNAALLWRGVKMEEILLFWGGDERGNHFSGPVQDFPFCVPVGSQAPHAAGVAYAFKLRKEPRVAVCLFGDGATSKGDVWEAMNFAGVHKLPVVFVINNNQWAISVPLQLQTASETLAQKAIAAGFHGEQVDGNDVVAVRAAAEAAIAAARTAKAPASSRPSPTGSAITPPLMMRRVIARRRRSRRTGRRSRSRACGPILLAGKCGARRRRSGSPPSAMSASRQRSSAIWQRRRGRPETMFDHLYAESARGLCRQRHELEGERRCLR